tara:strand:- start:770 stop:1834 length:1065 start_codon:yes stop_codon:yes gene_type:complete
MNKIIDIFKKQESIPLDKFINIVLYDKKFGYYMKKNPFGTEGDFITSPLISNLFGEMIAVWCVAYWEYLGKPKKIIIVELGPGEGSLCNNLLKTFKKFKDFYNCLEINLLEISGKLKKIQNNKIKNSKVKWINSINNINYGPIIFFGNEFFDSLPIKQIYKKGNLLFEKHVALSNNKENLKFLYKKISKKLIQYNDIINLSSSKNMIEYPIEAIEYLKIISKKIHKFNGCLLAFDYGYILDKNQNTLQSVMKHRYKNIFSQVGNSDITSLVNFALFNKILRKNNLNVKKIVTQREFLQKMGILERANILSQKMTFKSKANMYYRIKRLLDSREMGDLFKVLFAQKKDGKFSLGF